MDFKYSAIRQNVIFDYWNVTEMTNFQIYRSVQEDLFYYLDVFLGTLSRPWFVKRMENLLS